MPGDAVVRIDREVGRILDDAAAEVRDLLSAWREALDAVAGRLAEKDLIDGAGLAALLRRHTPAGARPPVAARPPNPLRMGRPLPPCAAGVRLR